MIVGSLTQVYKSPSEREVDLVIDGIIQSLGEPPEGIIIRKESKIQEFCVVVDANSRNTEALCYLALCHDQLENLQSGLRRTASTIAPLQTGDRFQNLVQKFWGKGKKFLKCLL